MELQTSEGNILITEKSLIITCKSRDINSIFKELYKLVPKDTKVKDIKKIITDKVSMMMTREE